jgi:hypothetical protein
MGQLMWGRMLVGDRTLKCSGGDSTIEPVGRFLQENIRGCD